MGGEGGRDSARIGLEWWGTEHRCYSVAPRPGGAVCVLACLKSKSAGAAHLYRNYHAAARAGACIHRGTVADILEGRFNPVASSIA